MFRKVLNVKTMDDTAIVKFDKNMVAITSDSVIENVHFVRNSNPLMIGKYAVNVNLSDLAAAGSVPTALMISVGIPAATKNSYIKSMVMGMKMALEPYSIEVIGGDTKESETLFISITAYGTSPNRDLFLKREGIKQGDLVAITGNLGKAGRNHYLWKKTGYVKYMNDMLSITPRIKEGIKLNKYGLATACMDLSDGLTESLELLSSTNHVGFNILKSDIAIDVGAIKLSEKDQIPIEEFFDYGGDYELLFTTKKDRLNKLLEILDFTIIGEATEDKTIYYITEHGLEHAVDHGFKHFR